MNVDGDSAAAGAAFPAAGAAAVVGDRPEDKFTDKKADHTHKKKYFLPFQGQIISRIHLILPNTYKLMCFDININGNRDVKFLECDYLLVQWCMKLTLARPSARL